MKRGPGTCLHDAIVRWTGERPQATCQCKDYIRWMNLWGADRCRKNIEIIRRKLREEAGRRNWWRFAVTLPGAKFFLRALILKAIAESEK